MDNCEYDYCLTCEALRFIGHWEYLRLCKNYEVEEDSCGWLRVGGYLVFTSRLGPICYISNDELTRILDNEGIDYMIYDPYAPNNDGFITSNDENCPFNFDYCCRSLNDFEGDVLFSSMTGVWEYMKKEYAAELGTFARFESFGEFREFYLSYLAI